MTKKVEQNDVVDHSVPGYYVNRSSLEHFGDKANDTVQKCVEALH